MTYPRLAILATSWVLWACGHDGGHGNKPDAPGMPTALTVTRSGSPVAGVHTYFLNADSSLVATVDTDAAGTASAVVGAGGSVTALDPFTSASAAAMEGDDLRTFLGVQPGDQLALTQTDAKSTTFTLKVAAASNANTYDVLTSCGAASVVPGGGAGGRVTLFNCHGAADIVILASALNGVIKVPVSGLYHPNVALTDGGTVDLTGDTYRALTGVTFNYANAPNATISISHTLVSAAGGLAPFVTAFTGKPATLQEPTIAGATEVVDTTVGLTSKHHVVEWGPLAATYMLDLANVLLPDLTAAPSFSAATKLVSWTEGAAGAAPDLTTTTIDVARSDGSRHWHWTVAGPYTAGTLAFPVLPTDVTDWAPAATDRVSVTALTNAKVPGGYAAVRAHVHDVRDPTELIAGPSGRVVTVRSP